MICMAAKKYRKEIRLSERDKKLLLDGATVYANGRAIDESEYLRYLIGNGHLLLDQKKSFKVQDLDMRQLINEVNKIGVSINQISKNNNSSNYQEMDKEKLDYYMKKIMELLTTINQSR